MNRSGYDIENSDLYSGSRRKPIPDTRSLLCCWAVHEFGLTRVYLSEQLGLTPQAVGCAVTRGEMVEEENNFRLIDLSFLLFYGRPHYFPLILTVRNVVLQMADVLYFP